MKKSIIIFAKGPSVLKCTRELVESHEDIAICNYPVLNTFFYDLIKNRTVNYHFCNCASFDTRYNNEVNKKLNIQKILNTNVGVNKYKFFLKNDSLFLNENYRTQVSSFFKKNYNLDLSTGTICIKYIIDSNKYNKIGLVGFDNFKKGEQTYYFKPTEYSAEGKRIISCNLIKKNGIFNIISGHDPDKSKKYIEDCIEKNKNIEFKIISNENYLIKD